MSLTGFLPEMDPGRSSPPSLKRPRTSPPPSSAPSAPPRPNYSASEVKSMSAKQYMDELIVPVLLKALTRVTKEVRKQIEVLPYTEITLILP